MKAENITILERLQPVWEKYKKAPEGFNTNHVTQDDWRELDRVQREEFWPERYENLWCGGCLIELLKGTFVKYETYLKTLPKEEPVKKKRIGKA
jgi:hypothetical protein